MFTVVWTSWALDKLAEDYVVMDLPGQDRLAAKIDALNHRLAQIRSTRGSPGRATIALPLWNS